MRCCCASDIRLSQRLALNEPPRGRRHVGLGTTADGTSSPSCWPTHVLPILESKVDSPAGPCDGPDLDAVLPSPAQAASARARLVDFVCSDVQCSEPRVELPLPNIARPAMPSARPAPAPACTGYALRPRWARVALSSTSIHTGSSRSGASCQSTIDAQII